MTFLAELEDHVGEVFLVDLVQQLCERCAHASVHAHVEGLVAAEGEAAALGVELHRRDAQVGEHAVNTGDRARLQYLAELPIIRVDQLYTIAVSAKTLRRGAQRVGVTIEADQPLGAMFEQQHAVSAEADSAVDVQASARRVEQRNHFGRHHRFVPRRFAHRSDPELGERPGVVVRIGLALELGDEPLVVPDVEVVVLAEDVHFAAHPRRFAQPRMDDHAPLRVERRRLTEVVDAVEELQACGMRGGHPSHLFFQAHPDRHGVNADVLPREARHEHVGSVLPLDEAPERIRDLEPPLVIDLGGIVAPEHDYLLHFAPQKSTAIVENRPGDVNRKN